MVQFDFESIRNRLIERLRSKETWKDILFYSTNSRLIDIFAEELAYNMQMNDIYTMEAKWSLAKQISSIMAEVKFFNYKPFRKTGSYGKLRVSASSTFSTSYPRSVEFSKFSTFSTNAGLNVCASETTSMAAGVNYIDIDVVQGTPKEIVFIAKGDENETFTVLNQNIENNVFEVVVNNEVWNLVDFIREGQGPEDKVYTLSNALDFSGVTIGFGDGYFSKKLSASDVITFRFVETEGSKGNIQSTGTVVNVVSTIFDSAGDEVQIYCTNTSGITGGKDYEDIESIRTRAPKTYQAGNRAISSSDYKSIVEAFGFVLKANCWGETETNEDLGNLPGTFIEPEENVVHLTAISSDGTSVSTEQQLEIRELLNEKKSPTDIIQFEDVNFIKLRFNILAYVVDKKYSLANVVANIKSTLENAYSIYNMEFKKAIRYSDYVSMIDGVTGVDYHDTTIEYYKDEVFSSAYSADLTPEIYNIKPNSVKVYVKDLTTIGANYVQIAHDDGAGILIAESGYTISASSINYDTGVGALIVESGLTANYSNYSIRVFFETTILNIVPTKRYQIVSYGDATVDARYES